MSNNPDRFPANDRKILRRLDEQAMRQVALGIAATLASFVAIVWIGELWRVWPQATVVFGSMILAVALLQGLLIFGFETFYPRGPTRWRRRFAFTLLLRASVWSAFMVALFSLGDGGSLFFLAMFLPLGLGAALSATWLADIWTVRLYLAISVLPPFIALLLESSAYAVLLAGMLGVFFYALVRMADGHYRMFWRSIARDNGTPPPAPLAGAIHAKLLMRTANEMRRSVSTVADNLALSAGHKDAAELLAQARRASLRLVGRLEAMEAGAAFLRGDRVPEPVPGSLRRRCEEASDDIGIVAAEAGVLCTTVYDAALPERLRTDYELLFDGLRSMSGWVLEQLPPGAELVLRFRLLAGQREDYVQCAIDVGSIYIEESLRNGIDRCGHGDGILDPELPLPLAIACEVAKMLGGQVTLTELPGTGPALSLEVRLEVTERAENDNTLRAKVKGRRVLLGGGTNTLAAAIADELKLVDVELDQCLLSDVPFRLRDAKDEYVALLLDARDRDAVVQQLVAIREARVLRGARVLLMAPGAEAPTLPADAQRMVSSWLRLPVGRRRLREALGRAAGIEEAVGGKTANEPSAPLRVLLVDDNAVNRMVAQGMLEKLGCDVEVLEDGAPAVKRAQRGGVDLVLMDVEMPGMDGVEATQKIREDEATRNQRRLPIVAMTAHAGENEIAGFLAAGMDDVIVKPVSLATLATNIEHYRQRR